MVAPGELTPDPAALDVVCNEGMRVGLGNGPNTSTARAVASPGLETILFTLPFVDIPF